MHVTAVAIRQTITIHWDHFGDPGRAVKLQVDIAIRSWLGISGSTCLTNPPIRCHRVDTKSCLVLTLCDDTVKRAFAFTCSAP